MKDFYSHAILLLLDSIVIALSIILGYGLRVLLDNSFNDSFEHALSIYLAFPLMYIIPLSMLAYEGIYSNRYDFWHESRQIVKSLILSFILILAFLAMTQDIYGYSRAVIAFTFILMAISLPLFKYLTKHYLYHIGLWQREASVYSNDPLFTKEIFENHYLGYIQVKYKSAKTVFLNSKDIEINELNSIISKELHHKKEVIFIPLVNEYDLTHSHIYRLSSTRTNLIVFQNRLKSRYRLWGKKLSDITITLLSIPFILPLILYISYKIKQHEPKQKIFFKQKRLGQNGKHFSCYKFQTMYEDNTTILNTYLKKHPEEVLYYKQYHKYKNDPRITSIGDFLRRTSLDELPQIFNVFRGDMSFIGPRPYMLDEEVHIRKDIETILTVKPGITGLWQVNGRNNVDFLSRIELDIWYIRNWNLWMDLVIFIKTIKTVLQKDGAQ